MRNQFNFVRQRRYGLFATLAVHSSYSQVKWSRMNKWNGSGEEYSPSIQWRWWWWWWYMKRKRNWRSTACVWVRRCVRERLKRRRLIWNVLKLGEIDGREPRIPLFPSAFAPKSFLWPNLTFALTLSTTFAGTLPTCVFHILRSHFVHVFVPRPGSCRS